MRPLRLLKHFSRYNAGEIAGFEAAEAERLIAQGIAVDYKPDAAPAEEKPPALKPLAEMKKVELAALAKEELALDLDADKMKHADMIAAIELAREEKAKAKA